MRILSVSDLHYSLKQLDWLSQAAKGFDLVVVAGDLLDIASTVDLDTQALVVSKYFKKITTTSPMVVSSGNHDVTTESEAGERVASWLQKARRLGVSVDGESIDKDGWRFTICPWWEGPYTRQQVAEQIEEEAANKPENWIWIYHAPPQECPVSWTGKTYFGDEYVKEWIKHYSPSIVISGHVHQSPFRSGGSWVDRIDNTHVFNAGFQIGPEPACIIIDTEAQTAVWISQMGREEIDLGKGTPQPSVQLGRNG